MMQRLVAAENLDLQQKKCNDTNNEKKNIINSDIQLKNDDNEQTTPKEAKDEDSKPGAVHIAGIGGNAHNDDHDNDFSSNYLPTPFQNDGDNNNHQVVATETPSQSDTLVEAQTVDDSEIQDLVNQGIQQYLANQAVPATVVEAKSVELEGDNNGGRKSLLMAIMLCIVVVIIAVVVVVVVVTGDKDKNKDNNKNNKINENVQPSTPPVIIITQPPSPPSSPKPSGGYYSPTSLPTKEELHPITNISNVDDFDFTAFGFPIVRDPSTQGWLFDLESTGGSQLSFEISEIISGLDRHVAYDCAEKCEAEGAFAGAWNTRDLLCWCYVERRTSVFCLEPCIPEAGIEFTSRPDDLFCMDSFCEYFAETQQSYCDEFYDLEAECIVEPFEVKGNGYDMLYLIPYADSPGFRTAISSITSGRTDYWNVENGSANASLPAVEDLLQYQCVMVHAVNHFLDPLTLSNTLADYVDAGGTVVMSNGVSVFFGCQGRLMEIEYSPIESTPEDCDAFVSDKRLEERIAFDEESHDSSLLYHDIEGGFLSNYFRYFTFTQGEGIVKGKFSDGVLAAAHRPDYRVVYLNSAYCVGGEYPNVYNCPDGAHVQRWVNACSLATYIAQNGGNILG